MGESYDCDRSNESTLTDMVRYIPQIYPAEINVNLFRLDKMAAILANDIFKCKFLNDDYRIPI